MEQYKPKRSIYQTFKILNILTLPSLLLITFYILSVWYDSDNQYLLLVLFPFVLPAYISPVTLIAGIGVLVSNEATLQQKKLAAISILAIIFCGLAILSYALVGSK